MQRKIEELAEHKLRLDKPELTLEWDKVQHREQQIPNMNKAGRSQRSSSRPL
jgi:hypothetical protein